MKLPMIKIFSFVITFSGWAKKALEDGKITFDEGMELLNLMAEHLSVPLILEMPPELKNDIAAEVSSVDASGELIESIITGHVKPEE